jgi:hypothetical protein
VALTPVAAAALIKKGFSVNVEDGAGLESKFRNEDYAAAGAAVVDQNTAFHSGYSIQSSSLESGISCNTFQCHNQFTDRPRAVTIVKYECCP